MQSTAKQHSIGIIANPYSARDIRRLLSSATSMQTVERANIIERVIVSLARFGIERFFMMPDKGGISAHLLRRLKSRKNSKKRAVPAIEFLDMPITSTADDSQLAARLLSAKNVAAVLVLGGDGTHRVVAKEIGDIPIASISTGTNNAFPRFYEAILIGMAIGLYVKDRVPAQAVLTRNKVIQVSVNNRLNDIALVDLAITGERWVGARALWQMQHIKELYLAFCESTAIGMSSVGGLLDPVCRSESRGLKVLTAAAKDCERSVNCPIAPGLFADIGIRSSVEIQLDTPYEIATRQGVIALDGEREIEFSDNDKVVVELKREGPITIDIHLAVAIGARRGCFLQQRGLKDGGVTYLEKDKRFESVGNNIRFLFAKN